MMFPEHACRACIYYMLVSTPGGQAEHAGMRHVEDTRHYDQDATDYHHHSLDPVVPHHADIQHSGNQTENQEESICGRGDFFDGLSFAFASIHQENCQHPNHTLKQTIIYWLNNKHVCMRL